MSDGFHFMVRYACTICSDCPDFSEWETAGGLMRRTCLRENGPTDFSGVWVNDEIHPECPHRREKNG